MNEIIVVFGIIIIACIFFNQISSKIGMPMLLAFIILGMLFGSDGLFKIPFENFYFAQEFCSIALIFVIFYGGFGTNWKEAKKVSIVSILLSSLGVILTAVLTGVFAHLVLGFEWLESLLIGAVLSSTDAASVFSILRSKNLNLKYSSASILELESGSNDPWAYMLTIIILTLMSEQLSTYALIILGLKQVIIGLFMGWIISVVSLRILKKLKLEGEGFDAIFVVAIAMLGYGIPTIFGGNGYLSVYIVGIVLGNSSVSHKKSLVHFFDGLTGLMQISIFFLLGLLAFPSQIPNIILPAIIIFSFITIIARPLSVFLIMFGFKAHLNQIVLISWAGLRGATSIVFAIMATISEAYTSNDVFHIVFCIVLLSIGIQGSLFPYLSKKLDMLDDQENVLKTFSDYSEESAVEFIKVEVEAHHPWVNRKLRDIVFPPQIRAVAIIRENIKVVPKGNTVILAKDILICSVFGCLEETPIKLNEVNIPKNHAWCNQKLADIAFGNSLVVLIKRNNDFVLPKGNTRIIADDILVLMEDYELKRSL